MKQFKLPIGLSTYTVKWSKDPKVDKSSVYGYCSTQEKVIAICTKQSDDAMFMTYLHECIHASFYELGYNLLYPNEPLVESLSQNIARAIRALPQELK